MPQIFRGFRYVTLGTEKNILYYPICCSLHFLFRYRRNETLLWEICVLFVQYMPMYGKNLKKSSSLEPGPMILKLGMQHPGLEVYKVYINDDTGLTLTYFTARSN